MVDGAITHEEMLMVYFVDPAEQNGPLLELFHLGEFLMLQGPRCSGKSTRVHKIQDQLQNERVCLYLVSFAFSLKPCCMKYS